MHAQHGGKKWRGVLGSVVASAPRTNRGHQYTSNAKENKQKAADCLCTIKAKQKHQTNTIDCCFHLAKNKKSSLLRSSKSSLGILSRKMIKGRGNKWEIQEGPIGRKIWTKMITKSKSWLSTTPDFHSASCGSWNSPPSPPTACCDHVELSRKVLWAGNAWWPVHNNLKLMTKFFLSPGPGDALPCMLHMFPCSNAPDSNEWLVTSGLITVTVYYNYTVGIKYNNTVTIFNHNK